MKKIEARVITRDAQHDAADDSEGRERLFGRGIFCPAE